MIRSTRQELAAALALSVLLGSCGADEADDLEFPDLQAAVDHVQVVATPGDGLILSWTEPGDTGRDIWVATLDGEAFTTPVPVSDTPAHVPMDELRPAIAAGPDGRVAVAWTDNDWDIRVVQSTDNGRTFDHSTRLNGDRGEALQVLPVIGFDAAGDLHAVWLDPRAAPPDMEEPADLYYARVDAAGVTEANLTAEQDSSVCGCCRPHLDIAADSIVVTFRNTTLDGYRDPFQLSDTIDGTFGAPEPLTPPIWKIDACPIAGPVAVGSSALWLDGSTGIRRLLASRGPTTAAEVLLDDDDITILAAPRVVSSTTPGTRHDGDRPQGGDAPGGPRQRIRTPPGSTRSPLSWTTAPSTTMGVIEPLAG